MWTSLMCNQTNGSWKRDTVSRNGHCTVREGAHADTALYLWTLSSSVLHVYCTNPICPGSWAWVWWIPILKSSVNTGRTKAVLIIWKQFRGSEDKLRKRHLGSEKDHHTIVWKTKEIKLCTCQLLQNTPRTQRYPHTLLTQAVRVTTVKCKINHGCTIQHSDKNGTKSHVESSSE